MHFIGIICKALVAAINIIIWEKTLAKFDLKISIRGGHGKTKMFPGGDLKTFLLLLPREQSPGSCLLRSNPFLLKSGGCVSCEPHGGRTGWRSQSSDAVPVYCVVLAPPREQLHLTAFVSSASFLAPAVPVSARGCTLPSVSSFEPPSNLERQMMVVLFLFFIPLLQIGKLSQDVITCPNHATS